MTKLSDINKVLNESDDKLRTISDVVSDTRVIAKQNAVNTNLVASRIGKWLEGEKSKGGDLLEARRKAERVKNATVVASRGALNPTATTFTGGLLEGAMTASGLSAISGFASSVIGSIFGNRALSLNLAARAGNLLGGGAIYGTLAAGISIFGEDILTKFLNNLDPDDVTFTDEQKADIASRAAKGLTGGFVASIFSGNRWIKMAGFVAGAFGDEIYAGIERVFGEEALANTPNPLAQFGIGPDTLDFSQGPLKEALVFAVPLLAAGLMKTVGKALITRLAIPLTAGAAVGILEAIGWTGLANLIDKSPAGSLDTPAMGGPRRGSVGGKRIQQAMGGPRRGSAGGNRIQQAIAKVAGLSDDTIAALREMGYEVNSAGRLYERSTGRVQSLAQINNLVDQIRPPSLISRGLAALRQSAIGQKTANAFSGLANSWVGKTGRFLGRWALPISAALEGGFGYFDPEMQAAGMGGFNRISTGVASGMVGQTADLGSWLIEKALGLAGKEIDIPDFSEAIKDAAILQQRDGGFRPLLIGEVIGKRLAGVDPMATSIFDRLGNDDYGPQTGLTAYDRIQQGLIATGVNPLGSSVLDLYNDPLLRGSGSVTYTQSMVKQGDVINNNGFILGIPAPTDDANGGSNFGFIGGGVGNRR